MAAQDLTTLATLKLWLPISSTTTTDDTTISRLITAVSMDFQRATKRPDLLSTEYTEVRQGDGGPRMIAFHWPIVSVSSLEIAGSAVTESANKIAPGWYIDSDIDPERIWNLYLIGYCFTDGAAVALDYTAGYTQPGGEGGIPLPEDIEQAVIDWCTYRYKERPNVGATARRSTEGDSVQTSLIDAPPNVLQVIERYTRELPSIDLRGEQREERLGRNPSKSPSKARVK